MTRAASQAEVERIITELEALRKAEHDVELRRTYQVAIDRLHALVYRLGSKPKPTIVRVEPVVELPRRPSPSVVIARRPSRRA